MVDVAGAQVDPQYAVCRQRLSKWYFHGSAESPGAQEPLTAPWVHRGQGEGRRGVAALPRLVVATGFIARTPQGVPTTLQRDGSDFSATIFGALLGADAVTIWTDVDGVFSADPRKGAAWRVALLQSSPHAEALLCFCISVARCRACPLAVPQR